MDFHDNRVTGIDHRDTDAPGVKSIIWLAGIRQRR